MLFFPPLFTITKVTRALWDPVSPPFSQQWHEQLSQDEPCAVPSTRLSRYLVNWVQKFLDAWGSDLLQSERQCYLGEGAGTHSPIPEAKDNKSVFVSHFICVSLCDGTCCQPDKNLELFRRQGSRHICEELSWFEQLLSMPVWMTVMTPLQKCYHFFGWDAD